MKMKITAIASSFIFLLVIEFMCGAAEIASALNYRSSNKILNIEVGNKSHSVNLPLIHMHSEFSSFLTPNRMWESLMSEKIRADANRLKQTSCLSNEEVSANVPVRSGLGEYMIQVDFGMPKQSMYTLIDTGSVVALIPCPL